MAVWEDGPPWWILGSQAAWGAAGSGQGAALCWVSSFGARQLIHLPVTGRDVDASFPHKCDHQPVCGEDRRLESVGAGGQGGAQKEAVFKPANGECCLLPELNLVSFPLFSLVMLFAVVTNPSSFSVYICLVCPFHIFAFILSVSLFCRRLLSPELVPVPGSGGSIFGPLPCAF